jgi:hypothetical protein
MRSITKFISQFLEPKWVHNIFPKHFSSQIKIENNFLLSPGCPMETTGPRPLSALADSAGKGKPARLGASAHGRLA